MKKPLLFIRFAFSIASILLMIGCTTHFGNQLDTLNILNGVVWGSALAIALLASEIALSQITAKTINILSLGLFFGYVFGEASSWVVKEALTLINPSLLDMATTKIAEGCIFLVSIYAGVITTYRSSEELYLSIPFIRLKPIIQRKRDIIVDASALTDPRIIDFASSGVVDHHLIVPRFILESLYKQAEQEEDHKSKARRSLEVVKKLESLPHLNLRFVETDFPELKTVHEKIIKLARLVDANILTADMTSLETAQAEDIRVINLNNLSNALKPLMHNNEHLMIKIQRFGKEARQGVGYLEDGTMVVVNGGGEYIGKTIKCRVLSVKHTTSGRIIFCNCDEDFPGHHDHDAYSTHLEEHDEAPSLIGQGNINSNY